MDKIIIKEYNKTILVWLGLILCLWAIIFFFLIGVYATFWSVPEKRAEIVVLTDQRDIWQCRAKELEEYIETRDGQYRVATKFDNLFMMIADPNQVMDMEGLEQYIKDRKDFYKKVKTD